LVFPTAAAAMAARVARTASASRASTRAPLLVLLLFSREPPMGTRAAPPWASTTAKAKAGVMQAGVAWRKKAVERPGLTEAVVRRRIVPAAMGWAQRRHRARLEGASSMECAEGRALKPDGVGIRPERNHHSALRKDQYTSLH